MTKIRIYEIAKELNLSSKELIEKIADLNMNIKSHMSSLSSEEAELIKELLGNEEEETIKTENAQENKIEEPYQILLILKYVVLLQYQKDLVRQLKQQ